jgi:hypothetical protein
LATIQIQEKKKKLTFRHFEKTFQEMFLNKNKNNVAFKRKKKIG